MMTRFVADPLIFRENLEFQQEVAGNAAGADSLSSVKKIPPHIRSTEFEESGLSEDRIRIEPSFGNHQFDCDLTIHPSDIL